MTALYPIELPGLRGHHPLGFRAACGLLRSCMGYSDLGRIKLAWTGAQGNGYFIAVLFAERKLDIPTLTQALNWQCKQTWESPAFTWSSKIDDREKYRKAAQCQLDQKRDSKSADALMALAALASDVVVNKGSLRSTMLDLTSGNQRFLGSVLDLAGRPAKSNGRPDHLSEDAVHEALLGPWRYRDDHHALGWDPDTQRLHALRHKLPEKDTESRSVRAAVFLATQALPLFPCFAVDRNLYTTGFHRDNGEDWFSWPIWRDPISLDTLRSLLAHPFTADLQRLGVELVYRCRRVRTGGAEGNYQVFSHAQQRPWPRP
jgi:hypothetical protein